MIFYVVGGSSHTGYRVQVAVDKPCDTRVGMYFWKWNLFWALRSASLYKIRHCQCHTDQGQPHRHSEKHTHTRPLPVSVYYLHTQNVIGAHSASAAWLLWVLIRWHPPLKQGTWVGQNKILPELYHTVSGECPALRYYNFFFHLNL
jgi:hypothetical protein